MEPACRKDKQKQKETPNRGDNGKAKQRSAQQELKQRQRAEHSYSKVVSFPQMFLVYSSLEIMPASISCSWRMEEWIRQHSDIEHRLPAVWPLAL
ncbi:Small vasohibin-binding protein [Acipenser ruthenus]|uniref:Small vasohibin-binding protein n=1 Tax=Acipenser ruthenus TaxID=7906 RepID=A0A444V497_ACIRT|nr:Small vasohibin-binding protein [Acipenser ruthenus]